MFGIANNNDRADFAEVALNAFAEEVGTANGNGTSQENLGDLLCNLMHFARREGIDFSKVLAGSTATFWEELDEENIPVPTWSTGRADFNDELNRRAKNLVDLNEASLDEKHRDGTKFTVVGIREDTGQIISHHVRASSGLGAFASAAAGDVQLTMVVAVPGWQGEDELSYPGSALVDASTVLEQPEVFGKPFYQVACVDIETALRSAWARVTNADGKSFETLSSELFSEIDVESISLLAMQEDPLPAQGLIGLDQIQTALVKQGILKE